VGTDGFIPDVGFTCDDLMRVETMRYMADSANRMIILADSSKFNQKGVVIQSTFDEIDTIMLEDSQVSRVTLHRNDASPWLSLCFDAPVVGIWSPPTKNAPFICLEPWYGRCDRAGYEGDYRDKDWIQSLAPGERFSSVYTIEIA
jgi:galactose mutarotase-like enzyme